MNRFFYRIINQHIHHQHKIPFCDWPSTHLLYWETLKAWIGVLNEGYPLDSTLRMCLNQYRSQDVAWMMQWYANKETQQQHPHGYSLHAYSTLDRDSFAAWSQLNDLSLRIFHIDFDYVMRYYHYVDDWVAWWMRHGDYETACQRVRNLATVFHIQWLQKDPIISQNCRHLLIQALEGIEHKEMSTLPHVFLDCRIRNYNQNTQLSDDDYRYLLLQLSQFSHTLTSHDILYAFQHVRQPPKNLRALLLKNMAPHLHEAHYIKKAHLIAPEIPLHLLAFYYDESPDAAYDPHFTVIKMLKNIDEKKNDIASYQKNLQYRLSDISSTCLEYDLL